MQRLILICAVFLLGSSLSLTAEQKCSRAEIVQLSQHVIEQQSRLLAVKVGDGGMDSSVAPSTQKLIRSFKDELTALTDTYMQCEVSDRIEWRTAEHAMARITGANAKPSNQANVQANTEVDVDQVYGADLHVTVNRPANRPELVTVEWSFGIDCGDDSILLVYEYERGWKRTVLWQSGDYNEISGAFGDFFQYAIVPLGGTSAWGVAVAHGHPWCTSRWSGFCLDVIAPSHNRSPQRILFHQNYGYVREVDPVMKPKPNGFELRLEVGLVDPDVMTRRGVFRFRTTGDKVERIQPLATNGRDFVDEWLNLEWTDAERWSDREHLSTLKSEHDRIERRMQPGSKDYPSFSYGAVRACSDDRNHFQVEANEDPGNPIFFQILQGSNSFTMLAVSHRADPRCTGTDLMRHR